MSAESETAPAPETTPVRRPVRPFYWSVRRELWENRALWLAPLAVAAVIVAGFLYASHGLAHELRVAQRLIPPAPPPMKLPPKAAADWVASAPARASFALLVPYLISAFAMLATTTVVGVFYCLGSLYAERRDRTVLFWKSLPVSDRTTVASKAVLPLLVLPALAVIGMGLVMLILLAISAAALAGSGLSLGLLLQHAPVGRIFGLAAWAVAALALWWAPLMGWLMAVSAWARQTTFVWAIAPPAAVCIFERLAFGSDYAWRFVGWRLHGGLDLAFANAPHDQHHIPALSDISPMALFASPGLWGGLIVFVLLLAACAWLRRRRDPI